MRQPTSLGLVLCYPFWAAFCLAVFLIGRCFLAAGWVLFRPVRMHYKHKDPVAHAADKERLKRRKLNVFLELEPEPSEGPEAADA